MAMLARQCSNYNIALTAGDDTLCAMAKQAKENSAAEEIAAALAANGYEGITSQSMYLAAAAKVAQSVALRVLRGQTVQRESADAIAATMAAIGTTIDPARIMYGTP